MNGQDYNKYRETLKTTPRPIKASEVPRAKIKMREMFAYAKTHKKRVSDLTDDELSMFVKKYCDEQ